jgi:hypothetical protein
VIHKPGKEDDRTETVYRVIEKLCCMGKVIWKVVADMPSEEAAQRGLLTNGQFRNRKGHSAIDAAAIMVDRVHAAWTDGDITGVLLMDIKAVFSRVLNGYLVNGLKCKHIDWELIR